jgi:phage tail sheath protein FI
MAQYLSPGVYVEEISGPQTIEGVNTSIAGFVGPTRFGPVSGTPPLLTCLNDFVATYGSLDELRFDQAGGASVETINYLAQSVREFFDNGGSLLYVSRIFDSPSTAQNASTGTIAPPNLAIFDDQPVPYGYSWAQQAGTGSPPATEAITWTGSYPGIAGNVTLLINVSLGPNALSQTLSSISPPTVGSSQLRGTQPYDVAWISPPIGSPHASGGAIYWAESYLNKSTGQSSWRFHSPTDTAAGSGTDISELPHGTTVQVLKASLQIQYPDTVTRSASYTGITFDQRSTTSFAAQFGPPPAGGSQVPVVFSFSDSSPAAGIEIAQIILDQIRAQTPAVSQVAISSLPSGGNLGRCTVQLEWGSDGYQPTAADYAGNPDPSAPKTGLMAFQDVTDVSIVAAPGSTFGAGTDPTSTAYQNALQTTYNLITHCEQMEYRIAVLDSPDNYSVAQISAWRGQIDSSYAALYYPWVQILDPVSDTEITLPPSGFVAGIYARNDQEVGAQKAPANEVVTDALGFETLLNKGQQDVLNPIGVNCFRYFPQRGYLLWGARTATSDTEWQYVNLRRYMNYLKQSIDEGTQYVVFENNGPDTWAATQQIVSDFLYNEFVSGHLMGSTKAQAFFVRCDQTTMTQNDIENGRLICVIGVALLRPAEFVIFRIGQFTASSTS